jgi:hypothetical protein
MVYLYSTVLQFGNLAVLFCLPPTIQENLNRLVQPFAVSHPSVTLHHTDEGFP